MKSDGVQLAACKQTDALVQWNSVKETYKHVLILIAVYSVKCSLMSVNDC